MTNNPFIAPKESFDNQPVTRYNKLMNMMPDTNRPKKRAVIVETNDIVLPGYTNMYNTLVWREANGNDRQNSSHLRDPILQQIRCDSFYGSSGFSCPYKTGVSYVSCQTPLYKVLFFSILSKRQPPKPVCRTAGAFLLIEKRRNHIDIFKGVAR